MKYIYTNSSGTDTMEIEVDGENVVGVVQLVEPQNSEPPLTAEGLQSDLDLYRKGRPEVTIEDALDAYAGGYASIREADDES